MRNSEKMLLRAVKVMPGGVNSPARSFNAVKTKPFLAARGKGSKLFTVDGEELIDYCCSWGALPLGHAFPPIVEALQKTLMDGSSFGVSTEREIEMAELISNHVPYIEMLRLVNSGTEAVMTAVRLARGFTGRNKILKFDGCYHGHADYMLVSAGSGLLTHGIPSSAGISSSSLDDVIVAPYNNLEAVNNIVSEHGGELSAMIVEPVVGNMGLVLPEPGFLEGLRKSCNACGSMLIFDEVITGFRFAPTTYGSIAGIVPDITCLGKIIGGGLPIGAIGGKKEIMLQLAPCGPVYQAGTFSGNPLSVSAGLEALKYLVSHRPYKKMEDMASLIAGSLNRIAGKYGIPLNCAQFGGVFTPFFKKEKIKNLSDAKGSDVETYAAFFRNMLKNGVYLPPSQFELAFLSTAHTDDDMERFISASEKSCRQL